MYAIEELDASAPWVDGVVTDPSGFAGVGRTSGVSVVEPDGVEFPPGDPGASASSSAVSDIDVMVLYTAAAARRRAAKPAWSQRSSGCSGKPTPRSGTAVSAHVSRVGSSKCRTRRVGTPVSTWGACKGLSMATSMACMRPVAKSVPTSSTCSLPSPRSCPLMVASLAVSRTRASVPISASVSRCTTINAAILHSRTRPQPWPFA